MTAKSLRSGYLESMRAHTDEGGKLSHRNGMDLLAEVERLRAAIAKTRTNLAGLSKSDDDIYAAMVRRLDGATGYSDVSDDDDEGADPAGTDLFKPRGNNGIVNAEICFSALLLMGDVDISEEKVATWSAENLSTAYDWAMRRHLQASDNDDVIVPPRPAFIPVATFGGF